MALTPKQDRLYWQTWARISAQWLATDPDLTKAQLREGRIWQHRAAKCPDSHKAWRSVHLTQWLAHAAAVENPTDLAAQLSFATQIEAESHPEAARIYRIRQYLAALGKPVSYAAACAHQPDLPADLCKWPADALQAALIALRRTQNRAQLPGKDPF